MPHEERIKEALATIGTFASVGVKRFSLTATDLAGKKVDRGYWANRNLGAMGLLLPHLVPRCWCLNQNLIVRPLAPAGVTLAQLDDIDAHGREELAPSAFLVVRTSASGYQVWIAIAGAEAGFVSCLVRGIGADCSASGAGRLPGSPNCKAKYAPDFPAVKASLVQPGRIVAAAELEKFLAPPVQVPPPRVSPGGDAPRKKDGTSDRSKADCSRGWPDYERVLRGAPRKKNGRPDRSRADYLWAKWALERGNNQEAVIARLAEVSERAQLEIKRKNPNYLRVTVANAANSTR
jgi:hypothetical protein